MPNEPGYPTMQNPVTIRAAAALPAAGAWDATPLEPWPAGTRFATFYLTYTRGAAGGAVDFQLQFSPYAADLAGVEDWFDQSVFDAGAVVAGADTTSLIQRELMSYTSQGAAAEMFVWGPMEVDRTVERLRMRCRESGDVDNPGECHVVAIFYWGA